MISASTRLAEGMAASFAFTAYISLITKLFPQAKDKVLSARQFGTTLGNVVGLVIGSVAYQFLGYVMLFATQSIAIAASILIILYFPDDSSPDKHDTSKKRSLSFSQLIFKRRIFVAILNHSVSTMLFYFLQPILALKLSSDFGYSPSVIGLCVLAYFFGMLLGNTHSLNLSSSL